MKRRISRHGLSCLLAWLLCSGLYLWIAHGVAQLAGDRNNAWHHYESLVEGFLAGHTHVSRAPAPELLALADPFDPVSNDRFRMWDATLYRGKYYLYYGPAPAVLLMLPWKILTGEHLPQWSATAAFAIMGLGALALLLASVRARHFPAVTPAVLFFAVVLTAHLSWLPVILRRPAFWELPIVTAAALFWWSLFFLWKYVTAGRRLTWALAAGVALACAPAARPTYAVTVGLILLCFTLPWDRPMSFAIRARRLLPLVVPLTLSAIALILYNYLRFGAVLEFGQSFQLWGVDYRGQSLFSVANIPTNFWVYFLTLPETSPYFPFLRTAWIEGTIAGYLGTEEMPGLLFTLPAIVLGLAAWQQVGRTARSPAEAPLRILLTAASAGTVITGVFLFCFGGGCSRYIVELLAGWSLVTGIGLMAFFGALATGPRSGLSRAFAKLIVVWSIAGVWLASFEFRNFFRATQPDAYRLIALPLNYPGHWFAEITGQKFGPVALDLFLPPKFVPGDTVVLTSGRQNVLNKFIVERPAAQRVRLRIAFNDETLITTPVMAHSGDYIHVELHTPWLYPPRYHPYWNRFTDADQRRRLQTNTVIATSAATITGESNWLPDSASFEPVIVVPKPGVPTGAFIDRMTRMDPFKSVAGSPIAERPPEVPPPGPARTY